MLQASKAGLRKACAENLEGRQRDSAFTNIYIPTALSAAASQIDLMINDNGRYLHAGRTAKLVGEALAQVLDQLGYCDDGATYPMTVDRWRATAELVFSEAFAMWKKRPRAFPELVQASLAS